MYLLDTNVVSELRRHKPHGAVLAWLAQTANENISMPAVVAGEIQAGIELTRIHDNRRADEIDAWLNETLRTQEAIAATTEDFRLHARLMTKTSADHWIDSLIAAMAINRNLVVATRNTRDFKGFGVKVFDPFAFKA